MDCRPLGSSCLWDFPGKNIGVGCHFLFHLNYRSYKKEMREKGREEITNGMIQDYFPGDLSGGPWLRFHAPNEEGLGSILGWGTRSHMPHLRVSMPQLKIPCAATKT